MNKEIQITDFEGFKLSELKCRCGCGTCAPTKELCLLLSRIREELRKDVPTAKVFINSGSRCFEHNREERGAKASAHLVTEEKPFSEAADLRAVDHAYRYYLLKAIILSGCKRFRMGRDFYHIDVANDPLHPVPYIFPA